MAKVFPCLWFDGNAELRAASAFRNSYFYDHVRRTLFVRNTRLGSIGEFCIVVVHALAHIKAGLAEGRTDFSSGWNDADPAFLTEFYGLLECCTEEMFFMRLPSAKAHRADAPREGRAYRPDAIMSPESLKELEELLRRVSKSERESWLRSFLQMA
mgnify:CR=1 FL=1